MAISVQVEAPEMDVARRVAEIVRDGLAVFVATVGKYEVRTGLDHS